MRKLFWLCLLLAGPTLAWGQGSRFDSNATRSVQGFLAPIPGAQITICTSAGTGTPCSPVVPTSPVTLCTDATCSVAAPNPFPADTNGNWGAWLLPGTYKVSITATGVTGQLLTVTIPPAIPVNLATQVTGTLPGANMSAVNLAASGNGGVSGNLPVANLNSGSLADSSHFWRGDGSWSTVGVAGNSAGTNFGVALSTQTIVASVPVTGTVFVSIQAVQTLVGVGCSAVANSVQPTLNFTAPGGTAEAYGPAGIGISITGNGTIDTGDAPTLTGPQPIIAKAGTAITYTTTSTLGSTGCTTTPQYTIFAKAFF